MIQGAGAWERIPLCYTPLLLHERLQLSRVSERRHRHALLRVAQGAVHISSAGMGRKAVYTEDGQSPQCLIVITQQHRTDNCPQCLIVTTSTTPVITIIDIGQFWGAYPTSSTTSPPEIAENTTPPGAPPQRHCHQHDQRVALQQLRHVAPRSFRRRPLVLRPAPCQQHGGGVQPKKVSVQYFGESQNRAPARGELHLQVLRARAGRDDLHQFPDGHCRKRIGASSSRPKKLQVLRARAGRDDLHQFPNGHSCRRRLQYFSVDSTGNNIVGRVWVVILKRVVSRSWTGSIPGEGRRGGHAWDACSHMRRSVFVGRGGFFLSGREQTIFSSRRLFGNSGEHDTQHFGPLHSSPARQIQGSGSGEGLWVFLLRLGQCPGDALALFLQ